MSRKTLVMIGFLLTLGLIFYGCAITGQASIKPECSDSRDNDKDGYCDFKRVGAKCIDGSILGDKGCISRTDNDESNCGDLKCEGGETCSTCQQDCGICPPICGDNKCEGSESCNNCPKDCGACPPVCGNQICDGNETCVTCPQDCGTCPIVCGNAKCEGNETCSNCPQDCGACPPICGDAQCNGDETCVTCQQDCGACPVVCGDSKCEGSETCSNCQQDCGVCPPFCGDTRCEGNETCSTCPQDCGTCEIMPCTDTDKGIDYYVKGTTDGYLPSGGHWISSDFCRPSGPLEEYFCNEQGYLEITTFNCPDGCSYGACYNTTSPTPTCIDSDGGIEYYVSGQVDIYTPDNQHIIAKDACYSGGVQEYFCNEQNREEYTTFACPNGCSDRACI